MSKQNDEESDPSRFVAEQEAVEFVNTDEKSPTVFDLDDNTPDAVPDERWSELDDILFRSYKEQVWDEQFDKQMWSGSDEVPDFVKRWVEEVIEMTDPMWHGGFENIPETAALTVHKEIRDSLTQPQGWSINSIVNRLTDEFEFLDIDQARTITRSEVAAVLNKARETAYRARPDEVQVDWRGPDDSDTTEICSTVKELIEQSGGSVNVSELQNILEEVAREHTSKGGTPERAEEYMPHYQCRHTMIEV